MTVLEHHERRERRDHTLPRGDEKAAVVEAMFDRVAPRYDRLNRIISLGLDRRWRRRTVRALHLPAGSTVLDLACGTGDLCNDLVTAGHRPVGVDFSAGMLANAHTDASLLRADATRLPVPSRSVDGIVCGFALRNFVSLAEFFHECSRVLRPAGRMVSLDAAEPTNRVIRAGNHVWFRGIVPWIGARLSSDADAYRYLPQSTAYLPPHDELVALIESCGFTAVHRTPMLGGSVQLLSGTSR
jgi:demethylmenaquinone methyltransferase/2-methoxy-6-polyprenyl-1,4-benzoquinol methylase